MNKEKRLSEGLANLIPTRKTSEPAKAEEDPLRKEKELMPEETANSQEETNEAEGSPLLASVESEELKSLLKARQTMKRGRPRKGETSRIKQEEEYTRFCTLIKREHLKALRAICLLETLTLKEVLGAIYEEAIETYKKKHGGKFPEAKPKRDVKALFRKEEEPN